MSKKLIVNKGYTLEVVSWENDGDHYSTISITYDSKEKAIAMAKLYKTVFASCENGDGGIGNSSNSNESQPIILKYIKNNPEILSESSIDLNKADDNDIIDCFNDITGSVMNYSDFYNYRVCQSATITFSPEDIMVKKIEF